MKSRSIYFDCIILVILSVYFLSCKSPTEVEPISTPRLSLKVGLVWQYKYNAEYSTSRGSSPHGHYRWGLHEWEIISSYSTSSDTIYNVKQIRLDSLSNWVYNWDEDSTIYDYEIKSDTLEFTIILSDTLIKYNFPSQYSTPICYVPNNAFIKSDTVKVQVFNGYSIFDDKAGLIEYHHSQSGNGWRQSEILLLRNFRRP